MGQVGKKLQKLERPNNQKSVLRETKMCFS